MPGSRRSTPRCSGRRRCGRSCRSTRPTTATPTTSTTRGGIRKAIEFNYPLSMVALNALPPVPALAGDDWRERWLARIDELVPWYRSIEEQNDGPFWRRGSLRPRLRADPGPDDGDRRVERPLPQLRPAADRAPRRAQAPAHGAVEPHEPDRLDPRPPDRPRPRADPLVRPLAPRDAERHRPRAADRALRPPHDAAGARPRRVPGRVAPRAGVAAGPRPTACARAASRRRSCGGHARRARRRRRHGAHPRHVLPALRARARPAAGRAPLARLRLARARRSRDPGLARARADGAVEPSRRVRRRAALGGAPRRHVGPREPRDPEPHPPRFTHRPGARHAGRGLHLADRARRDVVGLHGRKPHPPGDRRGRLARRLAAPGRVGADGRARRDAACAPRGPRPGADHPAARPRPHRRRHGWRGRRGDVAHRARRLRARGSGRGRAGVAGRPRGGVAHAAHGSCARRRRAPRPGAGLGRVRDRRRGGLARGDRAHRRAR